MIELRFTSVGDLLAISRELAQEWNVNPIGGLWFRGVNSQDYSLAPGCVWRSIDLRTENSMALEFSRYYHNYFATQAMNPFDLYCLMQHHGLPTRLLDWTTSPTIALYFSLDFRPQPNAADRSIVPAIWAISPIDLNRVAINTESHLVPKSEARSCITYKWLPSALRTDEDSAIPKQPIAIKPSITNQRIKSQSGCFTLHGSTPKPINEWLVDNGAGQFCAKITPSRATNLGSLMDDLRLIGHKEDTIYQDLDSLTRRILREHFG